MPQEIAYEDVLSEKGYYIKHFSNKSVPFMIILLMGAFHEG